MVRTVLLLLHIGVYAVAATARPNIIFTLMDDWGWNNWEMRNSALISPNLDALAKDGLILNRHYAYKFCSPSRAAFISGRLPMHVNQENSATEQPFSGIPANMTTFPEKLQKSGYRTAQVGKWHCGQASDRLIPKGRGFDSSLGFFDFGEDHYTQIRGGAALADGSGIQGEGLGHTPHANPKCSGVDLWKTDAPAYGLNGTYGGYIYGNEVMRVIREHDTKDPLFMFVAWQNNHPPLQVPAQYIHKQKTKALQLAVNGMTTFLDEAVGNMTALLKARDMYENTLLVFSADNGGYLYNGGDNTPLRGGKFSDFEGGSRVTAFVSGGYLAPSLRGTSTEELVHIADWGGTFCELAGIEKRVCEEDSLARQAGLPQPDSLSLAALVRGHNSSSPRTEVPISVFTPAHRQALLAHEAVPLVSSSGSPRDLNYYVGGEALVMGDFKLIVGQQHDGPFSKPVSQPCKGMKPTGANGTWATLVGPGVPCDCGATGCLYNIAHDPHEVKDLSTDQAYGDKLKQLAKRLAELRKSVYAPDRGAIDPAACTQIQKNGGFWGPWLPSSL